MLGTLGDPFGERSASRTDLNYDGMADVSERLDDAPRSVRVYQKVLPEFCLPRWTPTPARSVDLFMSGH